VKCQKTSDLVTTNNFSSICLVKDTSCANFVSTHYKEEGALKCISCMGTSTFMYLDKCVSKCPTGYIANRNNYCFCASNGTITINNKCLLLPACPLEMGWDVASSSCLSCHFGCSTCFSGTCTSCNPGYFHYISPQIV
jgi:hypothetical protein